MDFFITVITILALALFAAVLLKTIKRKISEQATQRDDGGESPSYQRISYLFTPTEKEFYEALKEAARGVAIVFGKVRIADVIKPERQADRSKWQKAFNTISAKHFDYVLCEPTSLEIIASIELDDRSHYDTKRMARDKFVENACTKASLPLYRFKSASKYNAREIRTKLKSLKGLEETEFVTIPQDPKDTSDTESNDGEELSTSKLGE